jgi:hypothetical protein
MINNILYDLDSYRGITTTIQTGHLARFYQRPLIYPKKPNKEVFLKIYIGMQYPVKKIFRLQFFYLIYTIQIQMINNILYDLDSYRGITLASNVNKVFCKIVMLALRQFIPVRYCLSSVFVWYISNSNVSIYR